MGCVVCFVCCDVVARVVVCSLCGAAVFHLFGLFFGVVFLGRVSVCCVVCFVCVVRVVRVLCLWLVYSVFCGVVENMVCCCVVLCVVVLCVWLLLCGVSYFYLWC